MLLFGMSYICLQIFQLIGISHTHFLSYNPAYIFGMVNGTAQKESLTQEDVQALMVHIGIDKLTYSEEVAYQMTQFVIDATDEEFHPTLNAIIHRGLEGYFLYSDQEFDALSEDFSEVVQVVKEDL